MENQFKKRYIHIGVIAVIILFFFYKCSLGTNPEGDGKKIAIALCDCKTKPIKDAADAKQKLLQDILDRKYPSQFAANRKYTAINTASDSALKACDSIAQVSRDKKKEEYNSDARKKGYSGDAGKESQLDYAFEQQVNSWLKSTHKDNADEINGQISMAINTIVDVKPDKQRIKDELIGKEIPGWKFSSMAEFEKFDITKVSETPAPYMNLQYFITLQLKDLKTGEIHPCGIVVGYSKSRGAWNAGNTRMFYFTFHLQVPDDKWVTINRINSMGRCDLSIDSTQKIKLLYEINYPKYASVLMSIGPDTAATGLIPDAPSYMVRSREGKPINVRFTFKSM